MIKLCVKCGNKYSAPSRAWFDRNILHVCSPGCFEDYIIEEYPRLSHNYSESAFKESDRSFRSDYEKRFVRYLKILELKFEYEPYKFQLPSGDFYVPDFLVENRVFFEVKGVWDSRGKSKFKAFLLAYPDLPIFVVDLHMLSLMGRFK